MQNSTFLSNERPLIARPFIVLYYKKIDTFLCKFFKKNVIFVVEIKYIKISVFFFCRSVLVAC